MIYLTRHGQTEWNVEGRMQGRMESALTPLGVRQAEAMAGLLGELVDRDPPAPWRLVSSPSGRARATAEAISRRLGLPVELDERLVEIGCGEWEGRLRHEIAHLYPEAFASREWFFGAPGGESFEDVWDRVASWLADQPPEPQRRTIAVSHGVAGRLLRGAYAGLSRQETLNQTSPRTPSTAWSPATSTRSTASAARPSFLSRGTRERGTTRRRASGGEGEDRARRLRLSLSALGSSPGLAGVGRRSPFPACGKGTHGLRSHMSFAAAQHRRHLR